MRAICLISFSCFDYRLNYRLQSWFHRGLKTKFFVSKFCFSVWYKIYFSCGHKWIFPLPNILCPRYCWNLIWEVTCSFITRGADKSLARPTSRCILFDGENISFDASLVIYINSTNISPIMIIDRIYENQNFLSL